MNVTVTWLGHACFLLDFDGYRVVLDPYGADFSYPPLNVAAHAVYCSHGHMDHGCPEVVKMLPWEGAAPITVEEVATFHDDQGGALRGANTVRCFLYQGLRLVHMGDLGHALSAEQAAAIGRPDVLMTPVGGGPVINAAQAWALTEQLHPRCVLPMHYALPPYCDARFGDPADYISLSHGYTVRRAESDTLAVTPALLDTPSICLLAYHPPV